MDNIPNSLRTLNSWVLWKHVTRSGKATKLPYQVNGELAKADDPSTWTTFEAVCKRFRIGGYEGIGFEFPPDRSMVGIDLDGCRNPETGEVSEWAREVVVQLDSYAEVSPSKSGIKVFCFGKSPFHGGRKIEISGAPKVCDKLPAIEVYDHARYFAVTGLRLKGQKELQERTKVVAEICDRFFPFVTPPAEFHSTDAVIERARKYLAKLPPAVDGQNGSGACFHAACVLVLGFGLDEGQSLGLLREYSEVCVPPWSERELVHKIKSAAKQPGERNYLRNSRLEDQSKVNVPRYEDRSPAAAEKPAPKVTTIDEATRKYIETLRSGGEVLIETGINELDYALGGGIEKGEMIIFAARPSHGKSALALQCVHAWTNCKRKVLVVSEEMSAMMLGKRTLQFLTDTPQEHWRNNLDKIQDDLDWYASSRELCLIVEGCGTIENAVERIDWAVATHGVECVVVDYAQQLKSPGRSRYEQITNTSIALKQAASRHNIILLVLCQLSRDVESRDIFVPRNSDLKDSGQLEQDADVIVHLVWPWKLDQTKPVNLYYLYVGKNRNRAINQAKVECCFTPSRQRIEERVPEATEFDSTNWQ